MDGRSMGLKELTKANGGPKTGRLKPNPRNKKETAAEKKLRTRQEDFKKGPQANYASRVKSIWDGGYHRPGSNKK